MTGSEQQWRPNPAQRQAVAHATGPLRILAGAGSGKTTTLVQRIIALAQAGLCRPAEVLMLTFTTRATAEMRAKVAAALPPGSAQPAIHTYHAFALALVQEFAEYLALPPDPVLLTEGPVRLFTRLHFDRLGIVSPDLSRLDELVNDTLEFFSWHRHEGTFRADPAGLLARLAEGDDQVLMAEWLQAHATYRTLLREQGAVDYDDLIALAVELLEQHPEVAQAVQQRYKFILVDEYQDTDHLQGRWIALLAVGHGNLTVVGDPDQTIYSFRGAALTNILDLQAQHPGLTTIDMVTNYRSTPAIVAAATAVIAHNTRRKQAQLVSGRPQDDLPRPLLVTAADWGAEAAWLAGELQRLHDAGTPWRDMAVLVRKNRHALPLYATFVAAGIPARVVGGLALFADPEAMRLIGFLRALATPDNDAQLTVALSLPRYGLTDREIAQLSRRRTHRGEPLIDVIARSAAASPKLSLFADEFWPIYGLQHEQGCAAAIRAALQLHAGSISPSARRSAEQLLPLAEDFFAHADLFLPPSPVPPLARFCQYLDALQDVGDSPEGVQLDETEDAVHLLTVHAAKGLEWPVVFLPRLTERDFHPAEAKQWDKPFPLAWHHDREFAADFQRLAAEEERRLFYVAVTRARDRLYLSWAPLDPGRVRPLGPSAFLGEVGEACDRLDVGAVGASEVAAGLDVDALLAPVVSDRPALPLAVPAPAAAFAPAVPGVMSFSQLHTYQLCPYRFYLQHLLRLPGRPTAAADAGVRVHAAIERLAGAVARGDAVEFGALSEWARGAVVDPDEGRADEPEGDAPDLEAALRNFWQSEYAQSAPIAVEQEFHVRLGGAVIRGFIDRVHRRLDGTVEVVDFKTYNRLLSADEVRAGLQLPLYIKACREALGLTVDTGVLYFLKQNVPVRVRYTEAELGEKWGEAEGLIARARAGEFTPTPGGVCRYCPYRDVCPAATLMR